MSKSVTNGFSSRFDDSPLAFGMSRFENSDKAVLWRFRVTRYCSGDILHDADASVKSLREMQRFLEEAIVALQTDGGRKDSTP